GKPLLDIWCESLLSAGITRLLINLHYKSEQVQQHISKSKFAKSVETIFEPRLLGTAGTLNANRQFFDNQDGILLHADNYCEAANARSAIVKLGEQGVLLHARSGKTFETDQIPALNSAPQDVAGAGDCMLVASSLALTVGGDMWQAGLLGSLAAAIQVGRVGNTPITQAELLHELSE
ncbi:MAG: PfkB family carbohydrate kinase, partial [Acidimicrobiaceae bacterium]